MKKEYVANLVVGSELIDFFIIKSVSLREDSNGKTYLDMTVGDKSGEISAKKWNLADPEIEQLKELKDGDFIKLKATVNEWQGAKQLKISRIRRAQPEDNIEKGDFVKAAPLPSDFMYGYLLKRAENMADDDLKNICIWMLTTYKDKLMYYPAATKNHHAEFGGLLYHLLRMTMSAEALCDIYTYLNRDLVITGVLLHDMEKMTEILSDENGISPGYSTEGQLLGHLVLGVREIEKIAEELKIPEEKAMLLEHMVLSHHYEPEFGSPKKPMFPEAELLHYLDVLDARMYDMEEALKGVDFGSFSERVWTLENRRIYRPSVDLFKDREHLSLSETLGFVEEIEESEDRSYTSESNMNKNTRYSATEKSKFRDSPFGEMLKNAISNREK